MRRRTSAARPWRGPRAAGEWYPTRQHLRVEEVIDGARRSVMRRGTRRLWGPCIIGAALTESQQIGEIVDSRRRMRSPSLIDARDRCHRSGADRAGHRATRRRRETRAAGGPAPRERGCDGRGDGERRLRRERREAFGDVIARGGAGVVIASQSGHRLPPLSVEQNKALATTPTEELLALPFLQPDQITATLRRALSAHDRTVRRGSRRHARRGGHRGRARRLGLAEPGHVNVRAVRS